MNGSEIINHLLEYLGMRAGTFSGKLGYARPQKIYDIQKGKTKYISNDVANAIVTAFPTINKSWLLTGEGSMLRNPMEMEPEATLILPKPKEEVYLRTKSGIEYFEMGNNKFRMRVPLVPFSAYARYANDSAESITPDREQWDKVEFVVDQVYHGNYMAFEIKGDSMDNDSRHSLVHGDIVLARELSNTYWKEGVRYEKFPYWIIVLDSTILCKQIVDQNIETGDITCHSLNPSPEYRDFVVNLGDVYQLFNVVQRISTSW